MANFMNDDDPDLAAIKERVLKDYDEGVHHLYQYAFNHVNMAMLLGLSVDEGDNTKERLELLMASVSNAVFQLHLIANTMFGIPFEELLESIEKEMAVQKDIKNKRLGIGEYKK